MNKCEKYWMETVEISLKMPGNIKLYFPGGFPRLVKAIIFDKELPRPLPNQAWVAERLLEIVEPPKRLLEMALEKGVLAEIPQKPFILQYELVRAVLGKALERYQNDSKHRSLSEKRGREVKDWLTKLATEVIKAAPKNKRNNA